MGDFLVVVLEGVVPSIAAALLLVGVFNGRWLGTAIAIGVFSAYALLKAMPAWPHALFLGTNDGTQWLVWAIAIAGLLGASECRGSRPIAVLLLGAEVWFMLANLRTQWTAGEAALHCGIGSAAMLALWCGFRAAFARDTRLLLPAFCTACLVTDALVLTLGGSALLGQLAGAVAAAVGAAAFTTLWKRPLSLGRATALPLAAAHGGLLLAGHHFAEPPLVALIAAALAPMGFVLTRRPLQIAVTAVCVSCAILVSILSADLSAY